jgi:hypothetical protein
VRECTSKRIRTTTISSLEAIDPMPADSPPPAAARPTTRATSCSFRTPRSSKTCCAVSSPRTGSPSLTSHARKGRCQLRQRRSARARGRHRLAPAPPRRLALCVPAARVPEQRRSVDGLAHHGLYRIAVSGSDQERRDRQPAEAAGGFSARSLQRAPSLDRGTRSQRTDRALAGQPEALSPGATLFPAGGGGARRRRADRHGEHGRRYHSSRS